MISREPAPAIRVHCFEGSSIFLSPPLHTSSSFSAPAHCRAVSQDLKRDKREEEHIVEHAYKDSEVSFLPRSGSGTWSLGSTLRVFSSAYHLPDPLVSYPPGFRLEPVRNCIRDSRAQRAVLACSRSHDAGSLAHHAPISKTRKLYTTVLVTSERTDFVSKESREGKT